MGVCVLAVSFLAGVYFSAKYGIKRLFSPKEATTPESKEKESVPDPPKIQSIVDCVNSAGEPKKFLMPDMIKEGELSIFAGREGAGKTLLDIHPHPYGGLDCSYGILGIIAPIASVGRDNHILGLRVVYLRHYLGGLTISDAFTSTFARLRMSVAEAPASTVKVPGLTIQSCLPVS